MADEKLWRNPDNMHNTEVSLAGDVTGLPEGMAFFRPAQERLDEFRKGWCIIHITVGHFRLFSEWFGIAAGQRLLGQIGELLLKFSAGCGGMPGFVGQEEFCLIVPYYREMIDRLYAQMQALISSASEIDGFTPIFGIAMIDSSGSHILDFYNHAALTAEAMKDSAHEHIHLYDSDLHRKNAYEHEILCTFQDALKNGEISFFLQPQVRASNGRIVGAESLSRWKRADGQWISPAIFVPILEKYGLISLLDRFIWEAVCRWLSGWITKGNIAVPVSVNVSQMDIVTMDIPAFFAGMLEWYRLPRNLIKIEITESAYADDAGTVRNTVRRLHEMGFSVLMDDFGSGYSSLNMLRSVNVDLIKLDAQFIRIQEEESKKGISILESIVNMTKNLSTPVIVEGVEDEAQVEFLHDLGCRYMQGFYFYKPLPTAEFEDLIRDSSKVDERGFLFKPNQQIRMREFLDENIFNDTMLNNALGPVVFYCLRGEDIDIIRFNEQFYEIVGIDVEDFEARRFHIQNYIYPADKAVLYDLFRHAELHWGVGARGTIRTYRPNGAIVWFALRVFYIGEDGQGKKFYASAQDVTETQVINADIPGAYYRCAMDSPFEFLFIGQNFLKLTGYTEREIRAFFHNRLLEMVHPNDAKRLQAQALEIRSGELDHFSPFRVRRKQGDYVYLAEQSSVTDGFGAPCWQVMAVDVTEVMHLRNQMRVLAKYLNRTILLLHRKGSRLEYEVAVHGLGEVLGLDSEEFAGRLNSGVFCRYIEGYRGLSHEAYTELFIREITGREKKLNVRLPDGRQVHLTARADVVDDENSTVEYIVDLSEAAD